MALSGNLKTVMSLYVFDPRRSLIGSSASSAQFALQMNEKSDEEAAVILQEYADRKIAEINSQINALNEKKALFESIL